MNKEQIINNFISWADLQLNNLATSNPLLSLCSPVVKRIIHNSTHKVNNFLSLLEDKDGTIDIENILSETLESVMSTNPFLIHTDILGDVIIGGGKVRFTLPFINKEILFNIEDLNTFKELMTNKT